jgi:hypothetical protein
MLRMTDGEEVNSISEDGTVEETESKRLNLLGVQLKPLHLCGILPPANISVSPWKSSLYNVFTTLAVFWFLPHIIAQIMALYKHWNEFEMVTALIFQIALFINTGTVAAYFVFHRKQLVRLLESLETHFVPYVDTISTPTKYAPIIEQASRTAFILIWALLALCWFVLFAWVFLPVIRNSDILTSTDDGTVDPVDLPDDYLKYFGLIIWLPPNINTSPTYELFLLFDSIAAYVVDSSLTGTNTIFFIFMFNISTHFKILASCIEDIDIMFLEATGTTMNENVTNKDNNNTLQQHSFEEEMFGPSLPEADMIRETSAEIPQVLARGLKGDAFMPTLSERTTPSTSLRDEKIHRYLIDCIKYHQALLE